MQLILLVKPLVFTLEKIEIQNQPNVFSKNLVLSHVSIPRVITIDKDPAYPVAINELKEEKKMPVGIPDCRQTSF